MPRTHHCQRLSPLTNSCPAPPTQPTATSSGPRSCSPPGPCRTYSSIHLTQSHSPLRFSFHKLTLLSPPLTANTLPLKLQLTLHKTASKFKTVGFHSLGCAGSLVHILTVLSCAADAMYDFWRMVGAQATSRTQSVWPVSSLMGM